MEMINQYESENNIMICFKTIDNYVIESVYSKNNGCLCISTQIGCVTCCSFCASGYKPYIRNLEYAELKEQIEYFENKGKEINQIHFGGIGEPLRNIENVNRLTMELGQYAFQITTSVPSKEPFLKLSQGRYESIIVSLHSAIENTRQKIIKNSISVNEIEEAIITYLHNKLRTSYLILSGINTSADECCGMISFVKRTGTILLLLGYNETPGNNFITSGEDYCYIVKKCIEEQVYCEDCVNSKSRRDKIGGCGTFAYSAVEF